MQSVCHWWSGPEGQSLGDWTADCIAVVRTLTGHRASCSSVEFHPFGEFFASGSLDNDLKIWDIRRKGCIHTYQGHNGAIKTVKFTPDGRWVVSGAEDNVVKLWDLTAGKLLHEFKFHKGPIQSIDFHPNEFLLATGSADRTVKFWDLETFELIGSAGPETTGVRSMVFHPDGKTLFCGLDESLKVFSWEPIRCHDMVGMRWSILGDLSIFDGKLLGCSYHQSSVGVWVADISLIVPYAVGVVPRASGLVEPTYKPGGSPTHHCSTFDSKMTSVNKLQDFGSEMEETIKSVYVASSDNIEAASSGIHSMGASSINQSSPDLPGEKHITSNSCGKALQSYDVNFVSKVSSPASKSLREAKAIESYSGTPRRIDSSFPPRRMSSNPTIFSVRSSPISISKDSHEAQRGNKTRVVKSSVSMPVLMPQDGSCLRNADTARKEISEEVDITGSISFNRRHMRRPSSSDGIGSQTNVKESVTLGATTDQINSCFHSMSLSDADTITNENSKGTISLAGKHDRISSPVQPLVADSCKRIESVRSSPEKGPVKYVKGVAVQHGRTKSLVESWEKFNGSSATSMRSSLNMMTESDDVSSTEILVQSSENGLRLDSDGCNDLLQTHDSLINALKSRLKKLQMVRHMWAESGMNGAIAAVSKLLDHPVQVDVITILMKKVEHFTLDLFSSMLPLLAGLLSSKIERHTDVSLEMLLKLVRVFGPVIRSTVCASRPVGIDIQAEQRRERCQLCLNRLEKIKQCLPLLIRKGGSTAKHALELNLALDD